MTQWYNKNPEIDIRAINLGSFMKEIEKELTPRTSIITMGVEDRPYYPHQGGKGARDSGRGYVGAKKSVSIAQIAAGHEFGTSFQPRRSFLETTARRFVSRGNLQSIADRDYTYTRSFLKALATKLYDMVIRCFLSNGWGTWKPLSDAYKAKTGRTEPALIDTGQLMSAVYVNYEGYTVSGKYISSTNAEGSEFKGAEFRNIKEDTATVKTKINKNGTRDTLKPAKKIWMPPKENKNEQDLFMYKIATEKMQQRNKYIFKYGAKKYAANKEKLEQMFQENAIKKLMRG